MNEYTLIAIAFIISLLSNKSFPLSPKHLEENKSQVKIRIINTVVLTILLTLVFGVIVIATVLIKG